MTVTGASLTAVVVCAAVVGRALSLADDADGTLVLHQAQVLWRHGARTPTQLFPADMNSPMDWPQGLGELTTTGMAQQFKLGDLLRSTYLGKMATTPIQHMDTMYQAKQVYIRSSDVNRCLASAYSNLAGMFPNGGKSQSPTNVNNWPGKMTPIPVHTVPKSQDQLLEMGYECQTASQAQQDVYNSAAFKDLEQKYAPVLKMLSEMAGYNATHGYDVPLKLDSVYKLWDTAYIEKYWGKDDSDDEGFKPKVAGWLDDKYTMEMDMNGTMTNVTKTLFEWASEANFVAEAFLYNSKQLAMLRGGTLLKTMVEEMKYFQKHNCTQAEEPCRRYVGYSAHDTTVLAFLRTLRDANHVVEITDTGLPKYAAAVAVELWSNMTGYYVNVNYHDGIFYENTVNNTEKWMSITHTIDGCMGQSVCAYETFVDRSKPYTDVSAGSCGGTSPTTTPASCHNSAAIAFANNFVLMTTVLGGACVWLFTKSRH